MDGTRFFIGNLPANITESDVKNKFSKYGQVLKVELKERKFLQPPSCFGFITLNAPRHSLQHCISELSNHSTWNGHPVTVDFAKESFLSRLEKERLDPKNKNLIIETPPVSSTTKKPLSNSTNAVKTKFGSKQNEESEESDSSETETSSDDENDDSKNVTTNIAKKTVNCAQLSSNLKNTSRVEDSDSSETDGSSSDESTEVNNANVSVTTQSPASSVTRTTNLGKNVMNTISKFPTSQKKPLVRTGQSSGSETDNADNLNIKKIVNQTNDVMKSFEQFSSVWQDTDSDDNNAPNDSSDESIFEAFKKPETEGAADKTISFDNESTTCDNDGNNKKHLNSESSFPCGNKQSQFPSQKEQGLSREFNNRKSTTLKSTFPGSKTVESTFPAFNCGELNNNFKGKRSTFPTFNDEKSDHFVETKNSGFPAFKRNSTTSDNYSGGNNNSYEGDFVNFPKNTRSPTDRNQELSEVTLSKFDKNRKIVFDEELMSRQKSIERVSNFTKSAQSYNKGDSNDQFAPFETNAKNVKKSNVDAEMKRLNAMEERRKDIMDKKNAIRQALANVDSQHSASGAGVNKKIIFSQDSDDDESDQPVIKTITDQNRSNPFNYTDGNSRGHSGALGEHSRPFTTSGDSETRNSEDLIRSNKKKSLFNDESSGSESEDDGMTKEGEFKIKKQFEGEKGLRLLELQASYNNDTRFNLDDRFIDEGEEKEDKDKGGEKRKQEEEGDEKERQMQILENVLGYKVKHHQTRNGLLQIPRFDPLNPDHKTLFVPPKPKQDKPSRDRKKRRRDEPVEVSEEKFYRVDEAYFKSNKQTEEEEPFSLLRMLNRDNLSDDETPAASTSATTHNNLALKQGEYRTELLSKSSNPFGSVGARFEYDSSDSDDEEEEDGLRGAKGHMKNHSKEKTEGATCDELKAQHGHRQGQFGTGLSEPPPVPGAGPGEKMFFFGQNDDRLKEAQEFWKQKPTSLFPGSGVDAFKLKRRELALKLKTKVRRNLKNSMMMMNMKKKNGGGGKRKKTTKMMKTQRRRS
uniref:Nucleolar protein 8 n=1 Tax=Cacopsylla melanoneura TaxID=428564 RepID=A0A8D8PZD5_9HEMI